MTTFELMCVNRGTVTIQHTKTHNTHRHTECMQCSQIKIRCEEKTENFAVCVRACVFIRTNVRTHMCRTATIGKQKNKLTDYMYVANKLYESKTQEENTVCDVINNTLERICQIDNYT